MPAPSQPAPTSAPIQPPSVRRPPPANRPPGQRPVHGGASAFVKLWWTRSCVRPGLYYLSPIVDGFYFPGRYAVVDDFGSLVEVPQ